MKIEWSDKDQRLAIREGWALFNGGEIQADDETGVLACDRHAIEFVMFHALKGSKRHIRALCIHAQWQGDSLAVAESRLSSF